MRRIDLIVNSLLLAGILVLGYLVATVGANQRDALGALGIRPGAIPDEPTTETLGQDGAASAPASGESDVNRPAGPRPGRRSPSPAAAEAARFGKFGTRNLFETIIAKPPAPKTPVPTPIPPPPLQAVVGRWQLQAILGDVACFADPDTKEEFQLKVGEKHKKAFQATNFQIEAVRIDSEKFEVELKSDQNKETVVMKMF